MLEHVVHFLGFIVFRTIWKCILSQRANATADYFANYVQLVHVSTKSFKNIMPSYLSIAWNISFDRQSLELKETADCIEVGCLVKIRNA